MNQKVVFNICKVIIEMLKIIIISLFVHMKLIVFLFYYVITSLLAQKSKCVLLIYV